MTLEQLIKLAQAKKYCTTIMCWDDDVGYQINIDYGCGDEYMKHVYDGKSLREAICKAKRFLDKANKND